MNIDDDDKSHSSKSHNLVKEYFGGGAETYGCGTTMPNTVEKNKKNY